MNDGLRPRRVSDKIGRFKTERHPFSIVHSLIGTSRELLHCMFVSSCSRLMATGLTTGTGFVGILVFSKRKITTSRGGECVLNGPVVSLPSEFVLLLSLHF